MKTSRRRHELALAGLCLLTVYGCGGGGGGGGGSTPAPGAPAATTTSVPVTVIDDAIENASVCLDKNKNGACDAGEPSGKTDVAGKVTLQVANADVGKFPILAVVGTDAKDAAYGPVTTKFTMTAPADQTAVVSPLTTLVQTTIANTGVSTAEAAASVQSQTGLKVSLFEDFTKNITPEKEVAAIVARLVVLVTQQQSAAITGSVGTTAVDGTVVSTADLNKIVQNKLLEILSEVMTVLQNPAVQTVLNSPYTPAQVTAALLIPVNAIVASPATGLTAASVPLLVAINNQSANPVVVAPLATPVATATLRALTFTDAANWLVRGFTSSIAQNTRDLNNNTRFVDRRASSTASVIATWNTGGTPNRQSDLHFTGTAWESCGLNAENVASVRDAAGNGAYDYCNKLDTGNSNRARFNVSGRAMAEVITEARTAGYTNLSIGNNSTTALTAALGTTVFPAGSDMFYFTTNQLTAAPAYSPGLGNRVFQSNAAVASGNTTACNANPQAAAAEAGILEGLTAVNTGTPCVFPATTATGPRNEGWGATTLSLGVVGTAATGGTQPNFYTTNTPLRVSFAANNVAHYYACQQRATDGANRNCDLISSGTYTIASLGDARVMSFTGLPEDAATLTYNRLFVERDGKVYFGYQNKPGVSSTARLNLVGGNALLNHLGIGGVDPEVPLALTPASYAGVWQFRATAAATALPGFRMQINNGTSVCFDVDAAGVQSLAIACTVVVAGPTAASATTSTFTLDMVDQTAVGTLNFLTGATANVVFTDKAPGTAVTPATGIRR